MGLTQPLTEMSTRKMFLESKAWQVHKADNLTIICEQNVWKMCGTQHLTTQ
jgi:hypothetical protein